MSKTAKTTKKRPNDSDRPTRPEAQTTDRIDSIVVPAHIAAAAQIDQSYLLDGAIVDPCPVHGSSGPRESASPQTVPRSVHPFSQGYPSAQRTQTTERATSVAILLYFIASVYFLFVVYTFWCHIRC